MQIDLHEYQEQCLLSDKLLTVALAGIQSGKTTIGSIWMRMQVSRPEHQDPRDTFIITAPTYRIMQSSTLPAFLQYNHELGKLNKSEMTFSFYHGPIAYLRAVDNEWSCEGITRCRAIWADEGGLYGNQAWINLTGRASPMQAPLFCSTTPYHAYGWLYDLYEGYLSKDRDDVTFIQWTSRDNPHFPVAEYERQRRILDSRMFRLRYMGQFTKLAGLVYPDFDRLNLIDPFKIDVDKYTILGGVDWGSANPMAITIRAISNETDDDYQIGEYKCAGLTADQQVDMVRSYHKKYRVSNWVGDSADPGMIALAQSRGVPIVGVEKGQNSVQYGIGLHSEQIRSKRYKVFRGLCSETEKEYGTYAYPPPKEGKPQQDNPIKINDHLCDANRYITMTYKHLLDKTLEDEPITEKTHLQKLLSGELSENAMVYNDGLD